MLRIIFVILFLPSLCFGANYYVDPTYNGAKGSPNGSYLSPWNKITQVNSHSFSTGDGLYFKAGTQLYMTENLDIRWSGTANFRAVIGAYYGQDQFGLGGNNRPILDGKSWTVPAVGSYDALIQHQNRAGYVTIMDLELRNSGSAGIILGNNSNAPPSLFNTYNIVRNCLIDRPYGNGILVQSASYNLIENNTVIQPQYRRTTGYNQSGAGIEITANHIEESAKYNVVKNNIVYRGNEGIGLYKQVRYAIVENNTVFDCRTYNIYLSRSRNNIVRSNLVYATANAMSGANGGVGIVISSELATYKWEVPTGWNEIFNNFIAGFDGGIQISVYSDATVGQKGMRIYNNRFVDNKYNFRFFGDNLGDWTDNQINQNYSFIFQSGGTHTSKMSPVGIAWNENYYNNTVTVSGNSANNARLNQVTLRKTTGWRNLQPGMVDKSFFNFVNASIEEPIVVPPKVLNLRVQ